MKAAYLALALGMLLAIGVLYYTGIGISKRTPQHATPDIPQGPAASAKIDVRVVGAHSPAPSASTAQSSALNGTSSFVGHETTDEIISQLQEASFTYDAAALKDIQPHLASADPAVRQAALDAVVTLGDPAGAKILREAAGKTRNAIEAAELRAKADYLELPPASLLSPEKIHALRAARQAQSNTTRPALPIGVSRGSALEGRARETPASQSGGN